MKSHTLLHMPLLRAMRDGAWGFPRLDYCQPKSSFKVEPSFKEIKVESESTRHPKSSSGSMCTYICYMHMIHISRIYMYTYSHTTTTKVLGHKYRRDVWIAIEYYSWVNKSQHTSLSKSTISGITLVVWIVYDMTMYTR